MSAECYECGSDLVYPARDDGAMIGECPRCARDAELDRLREALERVVRVLTTPEGKPIQSATIAVRLAVSTARKALRPAST